MIAFSLGPIHIYRYGIFYLVGFILGYIFLAFVGKKGYLKSYPRLAKLLKNNVEDILIAIFLGVLIGGRLGHIFIYDFAYFIQHPLDVFAIWKGGMSFIGGMIGVLTSIFILKRIKKLNKQEIWLLFDIILVVVPLGIMFGRIGNFLNQELYGIVTPEYILSIGERGVAILKNLNLLYIYDQVDTQLRINTNFLASFFEGLVGFIIMGIAFFKSIKKRSIQPGKITALFLIWYSFIRFMLEYIRQDAQGEIIGIFSKSQRFFIGFFIVGIYILWKKKKEYNNSQKSIES